MAGIGSPLVEIRREVLRTVLRRSEESIADIELSIRDMQASANEETKSSAGDKYETGRAMAQLEIEKLIQVLHERKNIRRAIQSVNPDKVFSTMQPGALAQTSSGNFLVVVNAGEFLIHEQKYFVISPQSPLAKVMVGKKAGDAVELNGKVIQIYSIT